MNPGARALALTLSLAAPALFSGCGPSQAQGGPPMAPPVSAAPAVSKNIPLYDEFSGRLEAVETVELRSRVAGTLQRVHFRDGQDLKRGELMFSIDARPFAAELTRLEAQLAAARSAEGLSASELVRAKKLLEQKAVSQQEFDQADLRCATTPPPWCVPPRPRWRRRTAERRVHADPRADRRPQPRAPTSPPATWWAWATRC
jgi:multidrug efflux pump subunit AcrA (membrane-fusion protein)